MPAPASVHPSCPALSPWLLPLTLLLVLTHSAEATGLNFTLPALDGRAVRLTDFRGQWAVINFWATWCTPCLMEMPELESFHQDQRGRAVVIGVNVEDLPPSEIRSFVKRLGITFPIALTAGQQVPDFHLEGLPTTFLVSAAGTLAEVHLGTVNATLLTERLVELERAGGLPQAHVSAPNRP